MLAAFRSAGRDTAHPTAVILLTDGRNDDADSIALDDLVETLGKEFNADKPVNIVAIGYGRDIDAGALEKITARTNGRAYVTTDRREARGIFLEAVARRACLPKCPT